MTADLLPDAAKSIARNVHSALTAAENVPSPCVSVCRMDDASGLCAGCLRTLDEIAAWSRLDGAGKRAVWQSLAARATHCLSESPT